MQCTRQIAERFDRDGFAQIDDLADAGTIAELSRVYNGMLDGSIACPDTDRALGGITRQIMLPHLHHPFFAKNPALDCAREIARDLVRTNDPQFLFSMLIYKPPLHPHETPWHQDMSYAVQPFTPAGVQWPGHVIAQFWLALDDVTDDMGCMEFIPGAHTGPMPEHHVASGDPADNGRLLAIKDPEGVLDLGTSVKCPLAAGSATVHGYSTPHYTGPNKSGSCGRRAYIFSFGNVAEIAKLSN